MLDTLLLMLLFLVGMVMVFLTLLSAIRTFVMPRSERDPLVNVVFLFVRGLFNLRLRFSNNYTQRDRVMAFYAPFGLLTVLFSWYLLVMFGYTLMFRAVGAESWYHAFRNSGSSLLTLGFEAVDTLPFSILGFSEAMIGMLMVALLIAYLPTMYSAFSQRESAVTLLKVRAGDPPSTLEMIKRYQRIHGVEELGAMWQHWERWFAEIQESHTSLAMLVYFRSPAPNHSWVTAAGVVLDAASLTLAAIDTPYDPRAALCIRAGYLSLRQIASFFKVEYNSDPCPTDPISISREEFEAVCAELAENGVPIKLDLDNAWRDFAGWRVNYDTPLLAMAKITMAPHSLWSSDREVR